MNLRMNIRALLAAPLACALPFGAALAAPQYTITDLGTFGGKLSQAPRINEAGDVAGFSASAGATALKPLLWQDGLGLQELPTLGGTHAQAINLNDVGQVVGLSFLADETATRGFVWRAGAAPLALPTLGGGTGRALAINNSAVVTGASAQANGNELGFVWQDLPAPAVDTFATLRTFNATGVRSQGSDINEAGQVVGFADNAPRSFHAALWSPPYTALPTDLGTLGGTHSEAYAINANGQVTGYANITGDTGHRAFLWRAGQGMTDLGRLTTTSNFSEGYDINLAGDVVGYSTTAGDGARRAIIRKAAATAMADLNGLVLPNTGWVLTEAYGINDIGQIVGLGTLTRTNTLANTITVERHAFLLNPDTTLPTITCPANVTTNGTQPAGLGTATAIDNLDSAPVITNNRPATFPAGKNTVTWAATDANGNRATCAQTVQIGQADTTPPVVNYTVSPAAPNGLAGWYTTAVAVTWQVSDPETTVTSPACAAATLTDGAAKTASCAATSTGGTTNRTTTAVKIDTVKPVFTGVPAAMTVSATGSTGAFVSYTAPTATDATSGLAGTVSCLPASGANFPMGTTNVTCSASDNAGNAQTASFAVTVADTSAPVITPAVTGTLGSNGWYRSAVNVAWTVTDGESAITSPACTATTLGNGTALTASCSATSAGGTATRTSTPVNVDTVAPTLAGVPAPLSVAATSPAGSVVTYASPTASDTGSGLAGAASCVPLSGATFPVGTTTVNCAATDNAGNRSTASFTVRVGDNTPPVITPVISGTLGANGWYVGAVTVSWTVTDAESTASACAPGSTSLSGLGQAFSCSSTSAGGTATTNVSVNVDLQSPSFLSCPATVTLTQGQALPQPAASDNLGTPVVTGAPASLPLGTTTVNWRATDQAGLSATCVQQVTVNAAATETIAITQAVCTRVSATQGQWTVAGTSSMRTNNTVQLYTTPTVPANLASNRLGTPRTVSTNGTWRYATSNGPACVTPISLRTSATGTSRNNLTVTLR